MSEHNNGGPAFPSPISHNPMTYSVTHPGMSLRDHFAGLALPAVLNNAFVQFANSHWPVDWRDGVAKSAYQLADAMLREREK